MCACLGAKVPFQGYGSAPKAALLVAASCMPCLTWRHILICRDAATAHTVVALVQ